MEKIKAEHQQQLNKIMTLLASSIAEHNEQQGRAAKSMIRLGVFLGQKILADRKVFFKKQQITNMHPEGTPLYDSGVRGLEKAQATMNKTQAYFEDIIVLVQQEYSPNSTSRRIGTN